MAGVTFLGSPESGKNAVTLEFHTLPTLNSIRTMSTLLYALTNSSGSSTVSASIARC